MQEAYGAVWMAAPSWPSKILVVDHRLGQCLDRSQVFGLASRCDSALACGRVPGGYLLRQNFGIRRFGRAGVGIIQTAPIPNLFQIVPIFLPQHVSAMT